MVSCLTTSPPGIRVRVVLRAFPCAVSLTRAMSFRPDLTAIILGTVLNPLTSASLHSRPVLVCGTTGVSDNEHSFLPKRKLAELATTPNSRSSGGDVDGFFASGSSPEDASGGVSGGYKARDGRVGGGGAAVTPVVKRRAILYDRSSPENGITAGSSSSMSASASATAANDTEAAAMAASALLAVRSSDGPKRCVGCPLLALW